VSSTRSNSGDSKALRRKPPEQVKEDAVVIHSELTEKQRELLYEAEQAEDSAEYLRQDDAARAEDKAAVAEALGGRGSGAEFLR
jgi:hypothetical protein